MKKGAIIVYYGCMRSGKSTRLIEDHGRATSIGQEWLAFDNGDNRSQGKIVSRLQQKGGESADSGGHVLGIKTHTVVSANEIYDSVERRVQEYTHEKGVDLLENGLNVYIDEAQFFDDGLLSCVEDLAHNGVRVVMSLLDLNYRGLPFELRGDLGVKATDFIGIATEKYPQSALCAATIDGRSIPCGQPAYRTQRYRDLELREPSHFDDALIEPDARKYIPVCLDHHVVPGKHKRRF